jgi:hypothetical protein
LPGETSAGIYESGAEEVGAGGGDDVGGDVAADDEYECTGDEAVREVGWAG